MARPAVSKSVEMIEVEKLLLDDKNFRLPEDSAGFTQNQLIELLARDYSLIEIGQSLADNGYFPEEPLIAVRGPKDKFTVVEGNRRVATLKLLLDPELAKRLKLLEWVHLAKQCKYKLTPVPVILYDTKEETVPYLGFRHITGVKMWEPFAKARFVNHLVLERGRSFKGVAKEIGSRAATIRANYIAYRLVVQAREHFGVDTEGAQRDFGVLYRSLSSRGVREFIGLTLDKSEQDLKQPVPKRKADEVKELFQWMFGSPTDPPVLKDSRKITEFGQVLESVDGVRALRSGADLDSAFLLVGGERMRLIDHLSRASFHLDEALRDAHRHAGAREVERFIRRCWKTIVEIVRHFPAVKREGQDD